MVPSEGRDGVGRSPRLDGDCSKPRKVVALAKAKKECWEICTEEQYWDTVGFVQMLIDFGDPKATDVLDIRPFRQFWELRLKGGFIKNINLRIYFAYVSDSNEIVILMAYKKEEDRRVSPHIYITLEDRLEDYLLGSSHGVSVYPKRHGRQSDS
jgi:hypothetical protein